MRLRLLAITLALFGAAAQGQTAPSNRFRVRLGGFKAISGFGFLEKSQAALVAWQQLGAGDGAQENRQPIITVPAGTEIVLAITSAVWTKTAEPGDNIYAATAFPLTVNGTVAIPAGTYAEGKIDLLSRPHWLSDRAAFKIHFTKLIFANGYTVELQRITADAAVAVVNVQVSSRSDVLLDNGSQIQMVLNRPLTLDANGVAAALRQSKPLQLVQFKSASQCRPIPATPGTPDTVIPGSPGTPATPPTVIPGAPGMPDTVIPGIPGTPATPDSVIPGTPGTPGVPCPGPPIVVPSRAVRPSPQAAEVTPNAAGEHKITIPAGTRVPLTLASAISTELARPGDAVHAVIAFPLTVGNIVAIPAGTYLEGTLDKIGKGGHGRLQIHFTRMVFTNGYSVALADAAAEALAANGGSSLPATLARRTAPAGVYGLGFQQTPFPQTPTLTPLPMPRLHTGVFIGVTAGFTAAGIATAILLHRHPPMERVFDLGSEFEMVFQTPVTLDAARAAASSAGSS